MIKLNCGAGGKIFANREGWINVDIRDLPGIDLRLDLDVQDLPYEDGAVGHIQLQDFLEHLSRSRQEAFMREVYRLLKDGGTVYLQMPDLEVLAKRYLGILEHPTELQHPLSSEQFAASLYGGQDYPANLHRWGYDMRSLSRLLTAVGLAPWVIGSDGGCNLICHAVKPERVGETIYLACGGGLGDVIQTYLADPDCPGDRGSDERFPSSDPLTSTWFRRLESFRQSHPNVKVRLYVTSHNPASSDLFEYHPCIDEVTDLPWDVPKPGDEGKWLVERDGATNIARTFLYTNYESREPVIYLSEDEQRILDRLLAADHKYIAIHPFAGSNDRVALPLGKYRAVADMLVERGYRVIFLGKSYTQNVEGGDGAEFVEHFEYPRDGVVSLVNRVSARLSTALVLNCDGFIGTHSAMLLPAWYKRVPSVCIVPPRHDDGKPWEEFFNSGNPTTWGADKDFNKTVVVKSPDEVSVHDIVEWMPSL